MLKKLFQTHPPNLTPTNGEILPDPWIKTTPVGTGESINKGWSPAVDIHPLIVGEQKPQCESLPPTIDTKEISLMAMLLQDALKVKAYDGGKLATTLEEALGLLSWMAMGTPGYSA